MRSRTSRALRTLLRDMCLGAMAFLILPVLALSLGSPHASWTISGAGTVSLSGAITLSGTAAVSLNAATVSCGGLDQSVGTPVLTLSTAAITSSGSVAVTVGTFTEGTSTLSMTGTPTTVRVTAPRQLYDFVVNTAGTVSVDTDDLTVGNTLTVSAGTFATNATTLTVTAGASVAGTLTGSAAPDVITVGGDTTATGTINLNGGDFSTTNLTVSGTLVATAAGETITVGGSVDFSAAGDNFTQGTSTLVMSGAVTPVSIDATGEDGVHNLTIGKALRGFVLLNSLISPPAENAFPPFPLITTTPTPASASAASKAESKPSMTPGVTEFNFSGRLMVIRAIPSFAS